MKPSITRFIDEYLLDHNGAEAARRAGYAETGAKQRAYILLRRPEVIRAIAARQVELRTQVGMQADEIIVRLSHLARTATSENLQLRALGMLMRHLGMFTTAKTPLPQQAQHSLAEDMPADHPRAYMPENPDVHPFAPAMPARATAVAPANPEDYQDDREPDAPITPVPSPHPLHRVLTVADHTVADHTVADRTVAEDPATDEPRTNDLVQVDPLADSTIPDPLADDPVADPVNPEPLPSYLMSINDLIVAENLGRGHSRLRRRPPGSEAPDARRPAATADDRSCTADASAQAEPWEIQGTMSRSEPLAPPRGHPKSSSLSRCA